eukprot:6469809-Amphidinium_carterae.1
MSKLLRLAWMSSVSMLLQVASCNAHRKFCRNLAMSSATVRVTCTDDVMTMASSHTPPRPVLQLF